MDWVNVCPYMGRPDQSNQPHRQTGPAHQYVRNKILREKTHQLSFCIINSQNIWRQGVLAALRTRAKRAPGFIGSLTRKTMRCAPPPPPIVASLLFPNKQRTMGKLIFRNPGSNSCHPFGSVLPLDHRSQIEARSQEVSRSYSYRENPSQAKTPVCSYRENPSWAKNPGINESVPHRMTVRQSQVGFSYVNIVYTCRVVDCDCVVSSHALPVLVSPQVRVFTA